VGRANVGGVQKGVIRCASPTPPPKKGRDAQPYSQWLDTKSLQQKTCLLTNDHAKRRRRNDRRSTQRLGIGLLYRTLRTKKDCPECLYGLTAVRFPFGQFWTIRNTETVDHPPGVTLRSARHARGRGWLTEQLSPGSQAITKIVREADSNG